MTAQRDARLPVTVIGGYLGAGKTTLVNHLLRHAGGRRLAVLVNDFGALPIDADLIEGQDGEVLSLAGGCICCSFGSDLMGALMQLPARRPRPDHVLLEASGVALPGAVAASLALLAGVALDAVVVLADAETVRARAADRYLADTIARQLAAADLVVLNKLDLVAPQARAALHAWLESMALGATVIDALRAQLPPEAVLGIELSRGRARAARGLFSATRRQRASAEALFERIETSLAQRVDARALAAALAEPTLGIVRAKGLLRDLDGTPVALQVVGARYDVSPTAAPRATAGRLVCIGPKGCVARGAVAAAIESACAAPAPKPSV